MKELPINQIIHGRCEEVMSAFPSDSIDLTVTSPPYDDLREYEGYEFDFETIAQELYRVTKPGGVVVWVVGDETIDGSETGTSFRQALYFRDVCGFRLHDTMIYDKGSCPFPETNRYYNVFEYMFVLCKGKLSKFNPITDRKNKRENSEIKSTTLRQRGGELIKTSAERNKTGRRIKELGFRFNIWEIGAGYGKSHRDVIAYDHPATFPEALARDHIISWSNPGDVVLDPMCGSGTTCKMAVMLGRGYIGIDTTEKYCDISRKRVAAQEKLRKMQLIPNEMTVLQEPPSKNTPRGLL